VQCLFYQRTSGLLLGCIGSFFDSLNALREGFQIGNHSKLKKKKKRKRKEKENYGSQS